MLGLYWIKRLQLSVLLHGAALILQLKISKSQIIVSCGKIRLQANSFAVLFDCLAVPSLLIVHDAETVIWVRPFRTDTDRFPVCICCVRVSLEQVIRITQVLVRNGPVRSNADCFLILLYRGVVLFLGR